MSAGEISDWGKRKLPFEVNVLTVSIVCFTVLVVATVFHLRRKKKKLSETKLPNGLEIFQYATLETSFLYKEIFEDDTYTRNGIRVEPGSTVFDVGANIGMFTLLMNKITDGAVRVFSFEPMPAIFAVLDANTKRHSQEGQRNLQAMRMGLSDEDKHVEFEFHPNMSLWSTADADFDKQRAARMDRDVAPGIKNSKHMLSRVCPHWLLTCCFRRLYQHLGKAEKVACHLRRMSDIIRENKVDRIDLLKVDVEGSELAVLRGIEEEHWPMIQQVVLEVETFALVKQIKGMLEKRGFGVTWRATEREEHEGVSSEVSTLFAIRGGPEGDEDGNPIGASGDDTSTDGDKAAAKQRKRRPSM